MINIGKPIVNTYTELTPNPETLKFVTNKLLYPGKSAEFPSEESAGASPLAQQLFTFPYIKSVFIASNFVTLTKTEKVNDWEEVIPEITQFLKEYIEDGGPIIDEAELAKRKNDWGNEVQSDDNDVVRRIKGVLETRVKPAVEMDGGAIEFVNFENGIVTLKMLGACSGCPSSMITLKAGIERVMTKMVPEVREVVSQN